MAKQSVITLPDGTTIAISPDLSPEQITAMITALTSPSQNLEQPKATLSRDIIVDTRSVEEIWTSSKREQVALFLRAYMSNSLWFSAKDIMDQQLAITGNIPLGETSALGTYLQRLFEAGYVDKKKSSHSRNVRYRITQLLIDSYPEVSTEEVKVLLTIQ